MPKLKSKLRKQSYELVDVDLLVEHPDNPNRGDVELIQESIQVNGFYGACLVQRSTNYILAGNHRWKAAKAEGLRKVPVLWTDADEVEALRLLLVDNESARASGYDAEVLDTVLARLGELSDGDLAGSGFRLEQLEDLADEPEDESEGEGDDEELYPPNDDSGFATIYGVIVSVGDEEIQKALFEEFAERFGAKSVRVVAV